LEPITEKKETGIPGVDFDRRHGAICPRCKRFKGGVTHVLPWEGDVKIRYHTCRLCGTKYKSIEVF